MNNDNHNHGNNARLPRGKGTGAMAASSAARRAWHPENNVEYGKSQHAQNDHGSSGADRGGFTLLELMLVVCILGVLLATSMPRFAGVHGRLQLRETAKTLGCEMRFCQEYAAGKGVQVRMTYVPGEQRFAVQAARDVVGSRFEDLVTPWDGVLEMPAAIQVGKFESVYRDGQKQANVAAFDPYQAAPTVECALQRGEERVTVRYAGATRLAVVEE